MFHTLVVIFVALSMEYWDDRITTRFLKFFVANALP
jgi:hypothetical protein